jgi:hypothetical protein
MRIARSTYYDAAPTPADDTAIVEAIAAIYNDAPSESWTTHLARRLWPGTRRHCLAAGCSSCLTSDRRARVPADLHDSQ